MVYVPSGRNGESWRFFSGAQSAISRRFKHRARSETFNLPCVASVGSGWLVAPNRAPFLIGATPASCESRGRPWRAGRQTSLSSGMRAPMTVCKCIIAQATEAQAIKILRAALMQVSYARCRRRQSSESVTTFRTTRLPFPGASGFRSMRRGSTVTVRLGRLTGGFGVAACNSM